MHSYCMPFLDGSTKHDDSPIVCWLQLQFGLLIATSTWFADCNCFDLSQQVQETKQTRIKDQEENRKKQDELEKKVELLLRGLLAFGGTIFCRNHTLLLQNFVGLLGWTSTKLCCCWFIFLMKPIFAAACPNWLLFITSVNCRA